MNQKMIIPKADIVFLVKGIVREFYEYYEAQGFSGSELREEIEFQLEGIDSTVEYILDEYLRFGG